MTFAQTLPTTLTADVEALATVHDAARENAQALRQQAIRQSIDELETMLARAADHAGRAARRYAQRLARHRRLRDVGEAGRC